MTIGPKDYWMIGRRFGRLTVLSLADTPECGSRGGKATGHWFKCRCDCGNVVKKPGNLLRNGKISSCGCLNREHDWDNGNTTYGVSNHPLYRILTNMKSRCTRPNVSDYKNYGARGIKVCSEWMNHPETFVAFGLMNGWKKGLTIDRIDPDGDYTPENCRFVTPLEQAHNKRGMDGQVSLF